MKLSRLNTLLLIAIIGINSYVIALPLVPHAIFWWRGHHSHAAADLTAKVHARSTYPSQVSPDNRNDNRLIIPAMLFEQPVNIGPDMRTLNKGLWIRPQGSTPDKDSNTVIVGHRFTYTNPRGTFYFLDKLKPGDDIALMWHGVKYRYQVTKTMVVPPTAVEIEAPSTTPQLTLYTCTPLWNPKDRLVVVAQLQKDNP